MSSTEQSQVTVRPGMEESCHRAEPLELQLANARAEGARRERHASQRLMTVLMAMVALETVTIAVALLWWLL